MTELENKVVLLLKTEFGESSKVVFYDEKGDGKHFYVEISSEKFRDISRVQQSQLVYQALDGLLETGSIHALRMKCNIL